MGQSLPLVRCTVLFRDIWANTMDDVFLCVCVCVVFSAVGTLIYFDPCTTFGDFSQAVYSVVPYNTVQFTVICMS